MSAATPEPAKRLSLSQIVEMLLTRRGPEQSTVTLARDSAGETTIEVKVRTGEAPELATVEDAETRAREIYDRLREHYPAGDEHDNATVSLSRNAKGETQIEATIRTATGGIRTLDEAESEARRVYDALRSKYPMESGLTAKPGSVA